MATDLFEWACNEIRAAEKQLGHSLSWRFLTTPAATLSPQSDIAFISQNPGGNTIPLDHGRESSEVGSAYIYEDWRSHPLQAQVQALFREIAFLIDEPDYRSLMNNSLMAYYTPFRSPSYSERVNPKESRKFAFNLWSRLIEHISPRLILTIDRMTFKDIEKIFQQKQGNLKIASQAFPTGWGNYKADVSWYTVASSETVVIARFPHLSRFKIFNRPKSKKQLDQMLNAMTKHMR